VGPRRSGWKHVHTESKCLLNFRQASCTDSKKATRLQQIENSSKSLHALAEHSSVYIPVSNKPNKVPSYLSMDGSSSWHAGALQAVALESITMPSRLRSSNARGGTLQDLEETFNGTGKRRIAKLELSIADPEVLAEKSSEQTSRAEKVSSTVPQRTSEADVDQLTEFDIDAFTKDYRLGNARFRKKDHIFGRAEASRGGWNLADDRNPRDQLDGGPIVQRYVAIQAHFFSTHSLTCRRL
jgi:hypothetical protein